MMFEWLMSRARRVAPALVLAAQRLEKGYVRLAEGQDIDFAVAE